MNDPRVQQLLGGLSYRLQSVVLWHRVGGGLIGAAVTLELPTPQSVSGEWLGMVNDCTPGASPPYHSVAYRLAFTNLDHVRVWVDLNLHQVVGVEPATEPMHPGGQSAMPIGTPELVDPQATWPPGCPHQD